MVVILSICGVMLLCAILRIYHAFLEDNSEVRREQRISGESATRPGDVFHPDFCNGSTTYFDILVRSALHFGVLVHSASTPGFAAIKGKDVKYKDLVDAVGSKFLPLVVDNFGVRTPSSIEILHSIAQSSTVWNGLTVAKAFRHLVKRLSVQLYYYR